MCTGLNQIISTLKDDDHLDITSKYFLNAIINVNKNTSNRLNRENKKQDKIIEILIKIKNIYKDQLNSELKKELKTIHESLFKLLTVVNMKKFNSYKLNNSIHIN